MQRRVAVRAAVQGGILLQDRALELLQHPAGLKPELLPQQLARLPVDRQRVGLPPSAIQRKHQLPTQPLLQRVRRDQRLELRDQLAIASQRQVRLDPILKRRQPRLLQPPDRGLRKRLVREISQRLPSPQPQRRAKPLPRTLRISFGKRPPTLGAQRLKPSDIDLPGPTASR